MNILLVDDEVSALRQIENVVRQVLPEAEIKKADEAEAAISLCREQAFDVVFLDISMPGKDGLTLAKEIKAIQPVINLVMVTAYPQFSLDALKLYVSDYIVKPALVEDVRNALANLRNPVRQQHEGLYVRCFGSFEVFYNGEAVRFGRAKVKELFAYLIDRRGASATNAELRAVLWGDGEADEEKQRNYFAQIAHGLREKLEEIGCGDIFVQSRDFYAIVPEKIPCDYYSALDRNMQQLFRYEGEYMSQYEWAHDRFGAAGMEPGE